MELFIFLILAISLSAFFLWNDKKKREADLKDSLDSDMKDFLNMSTNDKFKNQIDQSQETRKTSAQILRSMNSELPPNRDPSE